MTITELSDFVGVGIKIAPTELTSSPTNFLYVSPENIEKGIAVSEANGKYIVEKAMKALQKKPQQIGYGDYLIFRPKSAPNYSIIRYTQEINKALIPADNIILISNPQNFLTTFLQHETGRAYFIGELQDITNRSSGNLIDIVKHVRLIDIDSRILEKISMSGYIPPGNSVIKSEDLKLINVRTDVITIDNIFKRIKENEIRLEGYFQRKSNLWADDVKSRLIEAIIMNMPVPPLFFDVTNDDRWLVVDGLQRISAINSFYRDQLVLTKLDYLPEIEGKRFSDLDRKYIRKFEEKQLSYFAIYPGTPKSVRYKIFKNINVSALVLNRQEIRHAINEDEDAYFTASRYIIGLTDIINKYIQIAEKGANSKERMIDSELCLRFVAFKVLNYRHDYAGSIQDFLDDAMERVNSTQPNKLDLFKVEFQRALDVMTTIFPQEIVFTKAMIQKSGSKFFNANLFGVWSYVISRFTLTEQQQLISKADQIVIKASQLCEDPLYARSVDYRYFESIESLKLHIEVTERFLSSMLND